MPVSAKSPSPPVDCTCANDESRLSISDIFASSRAFWLVESMTIPLITPFLGAERWASKGKEIRQKKSSNVLIMCGKPVSVEKEQVRCQTELVKFYNV